MPSFVVVAVKTTRLSGQMGSVPAVMVMEGVSNGITIITMELLFAVTGAVQGPALIVHCITSPLFNALSV